jgi:hypothetical protein
MGTYVETAAVVISCKINDAVWSIFNNIVISMFAAISVCFSASFQPCYCFAFFKPFIRTISLVLIVIIHYRHMLAGHTRCSLARPQ